MSKKEKTLSAVFLLTFFLLLGLLVYLLYPLILDILQIRPSSNPQLPSLKKIFESTSLAITSLNTSSRLLYESTYTKVNSEDLQLAKNLAEKSLQDLEALKEVIKNDNRFSDDVKKDLINKLETYERIAQQAQNIPKYVNTLSSISNSFREALSKKDYSKLSQIKNDLKGLETNIEQALENLKNIDKNNLISPDHLKDYERSIENLEKTLDEIKEMEKLAGILSQYGDLYEKESNLRDLMRKLASTQDPQEFQRLLQELEQKISELLKDNRVDQFYQKSQQLNPAKAGSFAPEASSVKESSLSRSQLQQLKQLMEDLQNKLNSSLSPREALQQTLSNSEKYGELKDYLNYLKSILKTVTGGSGAGSGGERPRD